MISDQSRLQLGDNTTFQTMGPGQDTVLLSLSSGYLYTCNETTTAFLQGLDGKRTLAEITSELAGDYDVCPQQLQSDMQAMAERLLAEQLIVEMD